MPLLRSMFAALFAAGLAAHSPLSLPFSSNTGLAASAAIFFDLTVTNAGGVTLTRLTVNSSSPVGTHGRVQVWVAPITYVGNQLNAAVAFRHLRRLPVTAP